MIACRSRCVGVILRDRGNGVIRHLLGEKQALLTHENEGLQHRCLLVRGQGGPDLGGSDLTRPDYRCGSWQGCGMRWRRHQLALLRWHESPMRTPGAIVGEQGPKWEGGTGWWDHRPDWLRRWAHGARRWDESRQYSNAHGGRNWRCPHRGVCAQRAGGTGQRP